MSFSSVKFLNLSIVGLRSSAGVGGQPSRLEVQLVKAPEDTVPSPTVGTPVYAELGSFTFGGLLSSFVRNVDSRGGETYTAYCQDPREILRNSSVILGGYNGGTGSFSNLLNPYGSIEQREGFGASGATSAGILWSVARGEILSIINSPVAGGFGGPLSYKGFSYGLDLTELPNPPAGYRVGPGVVNLLSLIEQVVKDVGRDYHCELVGTTIRIRTVDRSVQMPLGLVQALVTSYEASGVLVGGSHGTEDAAGETASVFLIGGEKTTLHQTEGLRSFWGYRPDGVPIVGLPESSLWVARWLPGIDETDQDGLSLPASTSQTDEPAPELVPDDDLPLPDERVDNPQNFMEWVNVNTRHSLWAARWKDFVGANERSQANLPPPRLSPFRPAAELTDAPDGPPPGANGLLVSPDTYMEWEEVSTDHEAMVLNALPVSDVILALEYECSTLEMRFALVDLDSWVEYLRVVRNDVYQRLHNAEDTIAQLPGVLHNTDLLPAGLNRAVIEALSVVEEGAAANRERLYQFVRAYAENFYGSQWLVPLPFVSSRLDPETLNVSYSAEPTNLGWAEEGSNPLGLDSINEDLFTDPSGRFSPFVAFDADGADISESGGTEGSVLEEETYYSRCQVSDGIVFVGGSPYALITTEPFQDQRTDVLGNAEEVAAIQMQKSEDYIQSFFMLGEVPEVAPSRRTPLAAAVPLRSNVLTYGPWSASSGSSGRVESYQETSFVPWEYGSEAAMDAAANAAISSAITTTRTVDTGFVTLAGLPLASLGDTLGSSPHLTDVSVEYGVRGVQTTYRWQTYTPRPGIMPRQFVERLRKDGQLGQQVRRTLRAAGRDATRNRELAARAGGGGNGRFNQGVSKSVKKNTPHDVVVANSHQDPDGRVRQQVTVMTAQEAVAAVRPDSAQQFRQHALVSWNGLLRPVTTNQSGTSLLSKYAQPSGDVPSGLTSRTLNPYGSGNDFDALAYGQTYNSIRSFRTSGIPTDSRPVVLRGPLVISGWGRTTDQQDTNSVSGMARPDQWKTGPLDPLWDKDRGCWSVHDGAVGVLEGALAPSGSATMRLWNGSGAMSSRLTVHDWTGQGGGSGQRAISLYDPRSDRHYLVSAAASGDGSDGSSSAGSCGGGCGTLTGALDDWCYSLRVVCNEGEFDHPNFAQNYSGVPLSAARFRSTGSGVRNLQFWNASTSGYANWLFDWSGGAGVAVLSYDSTDGPTHGTPILRLGGTALRTVCAEANATFLGGRNNGFTGAALPPDTACDPNDFVVKAECDCCLLAGYTGPGWYGIVASDEDCETDTCAAVFLTTADGSACDDGTILICTERFDTEEEAEESCTGFGPTDTLSCDSGALSYSIPLQWLVTLSNPTGDITSLPAPYLVTLVSNPPDGPALYTSSGPISIGHTACDNAPNETSTAGPSDVIIGCDDGVNSPYIYGELHTTNGPYGSQEYDENVDEYNFTVSAVAWTASCAGGGTIPEGGCDVKLTRV